MKTKYCFLAVFFIFSSCRAQEKQVDSLPKLTVFPNLEWRELNTGIFFTEAELPIKSDVGDSKISILKINPSDFNFNLFLATQLDRKPRTVCQWADTFDLDIVLNAGMYNLAKKLTHRGFLKNFEHSNNAELNPGYNAMIAFNSKDSSLSNFDILDLNCDSWSVMQKKYASFAQGPRMLDCDGAPLSWNKKKQRCSMLVAALDDKENLYFVFCRSPYSHNQMIAFMQELKLKNAIYLEGGPETSLYIRGKNEVIERVGSYVSDSYAHDENVVFWKLPNVIGIQRKK